MKKNTPEVPEINWKAAIQKIELRICKLDASERVDIRGILLAHSCEPSAAAERISELLGVSYQSIFDIL